MEAECEVAEHWNQSIVSMQQGKPASGSRSTRQRNAGRVDGADLHIDQRALRPGEGRVAAQAS